jgi:hypothetical protein
LADAGDLKSLAAHTASRFESGRAHWGKHCLLFAF